MEVGCDEGNRQEFSNVQDGEVSVLSFLILIGFIKYIFSSFDENNLKDIARSLLEGVSNKQDPRDLVSSRDVPLIH